MNDIKDIVRLSEVLYIHIYNLESTQASEMHREQVASIFDKCLALRYFIYFV